MPGNYNRRPIRYLPAAAVALLLLFVAGPAWSQLTAVRMDIKREFLGIGGAIQRGVWTPVRVDLFNASAENLEVTCRWLLTDEDGDQLIAQREKITLLPNRNQGVWLYAVPPMNTRAGDSWVFQAVSSDNELLASAEVQLDDKALVSASVNLVGLSGSRHLGLQPWQRWSTTHEPIGIVRELNIETLPDRWYGMEGLSSLVWYPVDGGEPTSTQMSDSSKRALREWIYRGGHLVLMLPYAGQQWTSADSGLADLIEPLKASDFKQKSARPPISVFGILRNANPVPMLTFDLSNAPEYSVLAEAEVPQVSANPPGGNQTKKEPLIVTRRFGFGQITLVGIDLSDPTVLQSLDDFRMHKVWTRIFSWRGSKTGELLPVSEFENPQTANQYREMRKASGFSELGDWIAPRVARQRETGPAVGLAFILFVIYALAAALTFPNLLRGKGWERHSWMLFVGIVALFSVVAWGGAWVMRPSSSSAAHFTVLDIDGNSNLVRARSWQSVLIPKFTNAQVDVPSKSDGFQLMDVVNLVSSAGHELRPESPGYPDRRTYAYNAAQPSEVGIPMRSTTKSLMLDYLGQITAQQDGLQKAWTLPNATLAVGNNGLPTGTITHAFPGPLRDVHIIYCPGGPQTPGLPTQTQPPGRPLVYQYRNANNQSIWNPNQPLAMPPSSKDYTALWIRPKLNLPSGDRPWKTEGFLGQQIDRRKFGESSSDSAVVYDTMLLSFFDALPPPIYENKHLNMINFGGAVSNAGYHRSLLRDLDMTKLVTGRRVIIIGHLKDVSSPVPMTIDGEAVNSEGWTVVRWIYDL